MKADQSSEKQRIRAQILKSRNSMTLSEIAAKSADITARLSALDEFKRAKAVFLYIHFGSEARTDGIISICGDSVPVAAPRTLPAPRAMEFAYIRGAVMRADRFGVMSPVGGLLAEPDKDSVMIVPGVAFDRRKSRIGYGGGYYDSYLNARERVFTRVGVCFSRQLSREIFAADPTDSDMDIIVTEDGVIF
jgi:5-formyltetrahydrofolate cyclo-ligase